MKYSISRGGTSPVQLRDIVPQHAQAVRRYPPRILFRSTQPSGSSLTAAMIRTFTCFSSSPMRRDAVVSSSTRSSFACSRQLHGVDLVEEQSAAVGRSNRPGVSLAPV